MTETAGTEHVEEIEVEERFPSDSAFPGLLKKAPGAARPYILLARLDRPVGIWLLFLPCLIGLSQMSITGGFAVLDIVWTALFFVGAVAMRGAGCTWNDIADREIDAQVARTATRPLPSGQVTLRNAYLFLAGQIAVGFLVWLCLPVVAKIVALLALPMVGGYPFMKRITWWPQAWLGFTFNWGALIGGAVAYGSLTGANVVLYLGLAAWTIAYDTIYAMQDVEDDALIGVRSTARLFGDKVLTGVFAFFLLATMLIAVGAYYAGAGRLGALTSIMFLGHGLWQIIRLQRGGKEVALSVFKSNIGAGAILASGLGVAAML